MPVYKHLKRLKKDDGRGVICVGICGRVAYTVVFGEWSADGEHIVTYKTTKKKCKVPATFEWMSRGVEEREQVSGGKRGGVW